MYRAFVGALAVVGLGYTCAAAVEIKVLSAGAVEPGLHKVAEQFKRATGHDLKIQFNTAPQIAQRMQEGAIADVVIAPPPVLRQQLDAGGIVADGQVILGRVGVGVTVRDDVPVPNISTTEDLKAAVLAADRVVYNIASTGLYLERLFERLGIVEQIKSRSTRPASGEAVMLRILGGTGKEIGFGAVTEIKLFTAKGLKYVGPLPADAQNYTSYVAVLTTNGPERDAAKAFITYLATAEARQTFRAAGIE
jgi:molybdate transport system substrate-binding protein